MIGSALIEECLRHDVEVYAVVRADSSKKDRLPRDKRVHLVNGSLEDLSMLPGRISEKCDTFYHIAWGNTGENRNRSSELQSRNITYTLEAVKAAEKLGCRRLSVQVLRQSMARKTWNGFRRTALLILPHLMGQANWHPDILPLCYVKSLVWSVSGQGFSAFMEFTKKKPQ